MHALCAVSSAGSVSRRRPGQRSTHHWGLSALSSRPPVFLCSSTESPPPRAAMEKHHPIPTCQQDVAMSATSLPMYHPGLQVLSPKDCVLHLGNARVGRIAFMSDGYPIILPVTHGMD